MTASELEKAAKYYPWKPNETVDQIFKAGALWLLGRCKPGEQLSECKGYVNLCYLQQLCGEKEHENK